MREAARDRLVNWMKALDEARTVAEVLEIVEEFLARRSDVYWAGVPQPLREPSIASVEDLQAWHHNLVRTISDMASPGTPMQELCVFSLRATVRVHQIGLKEEGPPKGSSNDREFSAAAMQMPQRSRR